MLVRQASTVDRRAKLATITDEGKKFVDEVQPAMIRAQQCFVASLSDEDYETLMRILTELLLNSNEYGRAPLRALPSLESETK